MPVHQHLGRLRAVLTRVASGLVVVSAAFGVIAVLTGGFGETEARILGTALLVAAGVFAVLAGAAPGSRSWRRLASFVAVSVSPVAAASTIALIWRDEPSDVVVRIVVTLLCVAVGALAVRLIASLQIGPGWERYAIATSALGAALTCVTVNFVWEGPHGETIVRWYAAWVVVFGAAVLLLALRAGQPTTPAQTGPADADHGERALVERLSESCAAHRVTVAVAESLTAGALQASIGRRPGASRYFRGGVVAYSPDMKVKSLGVDPVDIEGADAVSEMVARQMATGVRDLFEADLGVAVTGWSQPDPDRLVFFPQAALAIAGPGAEVHTAWIVGAGESREQMIRQVVIESLEAMCHVVAQKGSPDAH